MIKFYMTQRIIYLDTKIYAWSCKKYWLYNMKFMINTNWKKLDVIYENNNDIKPFFLLSTTFRSIDLLKGIWGFNWICQNWLKVLGVTHFKSNNHSILLVILVRNHLIVCWVKFCFWKRVDLHFSKSRWNHMLA